MQIVLGVLLVAVGSVLLTKSAMIDAEANPLDRFPLLVSPPMRLRRANLLRGLGGGLVVLGVLTFSREIGYAGLLAIIPAWVAPVAVMLRHNRLVSA